MRQLSLGFAFAALAVATMPALAQSFPQTIENCGVTLTLDAAPQRVITVKSTATEMLLALGLGSTIVGVGFQDGPAPEPWTAQASQLPVLSDKVPSQEVALEAEPDLIYGGWESNFSADGVGDRASLAALGIDSYVSPAACRSIKPAKLPFDAVFAEIAEIGNIFGVADRAIALIDQQRSDLAAIPRDSRQLSAVWYSSGTKTPYVGAGSGAPAMMIEALGLSNVMADVDEGWVSASWEAIVDADPDVIILVDATWNSAAQKKQLLAENPVTSQLDAVKNERYLVLPFPASEAGVRNVGATADMAQQLAALSFQP